MSEFKPWKAPIQLKRKVSGNYYRASADQLKPVLYDMKETEKWPAEGKSVTMYDGIFFWVRSLILARHLGMHSRLMCECPECGKIISYGRLHQHMRVHHIE